MPNICHMYVKNIKYMFKMSSICQICRINTDGKKIERATAQKTQDVEKCKINVKM